MRNPLRVNHRYGVHLRPAALYLSVVVTVLQPNRVYAQASMGPQNPKNPNGLAPVPNFVHNPDGWSVSATQAPSLTLSATPSTTEEKKRKPKAARTPSCEDIQLKPVVPEPTPSPFKQWLRDWSFSVSTIYQFSDQRSRVGGLSWDSNFIGIDLAAAFNAKPYTSFDLSYFYSHATGSSPSGADDITNQHIGIVRILQPLDNIWCSDWKPADQSDRPWNQQWALLVRAAYGGSLGSLATPNLAFEHDTTYTFIGDTLLDYQLAWFPSRYIPPGLSPDDLRRLRDCDTYSYPNLVFEFSTGTQFNTARFDSSSSGSSTTTSGRQFDYLNSAILTGSLPCRLGFLVAVTWDAPFDSEPLHGARPYRANTATFTGGLVYNLYPSTDPRAFCHFDLKRFSFSLLYSYTAFDPFTETNTIQFQASYSF